MNKTAKKYLDELFKIKCASITTLDEKGSPETRIINVMMVDDDGLYFIACTGKPFYKQLCDDKRIAIAAFDASTCAAIRLQGTVIKTNEQKRQEVLDYMRIHRSGFFELYDGEDLEIIDAFMIDKAEGEYYHLTNKPIFRQSFSYGGAQQKSQGFEINDNCIQCGICKEKCPGFCIEYENDRYTIIKEKCLQCGLCQNKCPANAITKLHEANC